MKQIIHLFRVRKVNGNGSIDFYFRLLRSEATHAPTVLWWGLLNAKILDFGVKAGIGGFHPPRKQLTGKACNGVPHHIEGFQMEHRRKEAAMPEKSLKRSINFSPETLKALDTLAAKNNTTTSELVRQFVEKGLSIEGYTQDIDFIARIIRQELMAVYHLEDIKAVVEQQTNRIAKMHMKSGKIDAAAFFLLIKVLMNIAHEGSEDQFDQMLNEAVTLGVDYMQKKDFQINSFLQDTDNLRRLADKL